MELKRHQILLSVVQASSPGQEFDEISGVENAHWIEGFPRRCHRHGSFNGVERSRDSQFGQTLLDERKTLPNVLLPVGKDVERRKIMNLILWFY